MRFGELFAGGSGPVVSFELFPPRSEEASRQLDRVLPRLVALKPHYITVTYGAFGGTRDRTLQIARRIKQEFGLESACHLTCVGVPRSELDGMLADIHAAGIENIVALRGDPPEGSVEFRPPPDSYWHANELVEHIRRFERQRGLGPFGIAVAGYPEKHLEAPDMQTDLLNLKRKVEAGADLVITQLFFDNVHYFRFVEQARAVGIDVPIVPGLMPIASAKQIERFTKMCGATVPAELRQRLEQAGEDKGKAMQIGTEHCLRQAAELLEGGAPGLHFFVLNRSRQIEQIMGRLPL
jgi:methylenetetrahydrofolate reductase (NADPH)